MATEAFPMPKYLVLPVPGNIAQMLLTSIPYVSKFVPWYKPVGNEMEMDAATCLPFRTPNVIVDFPVTVECHKERTKNSRHNFMI
jgi:hypothetical protein